ncbi:MAG: hypothetical protein ACPLKQ_04270 [Candidatus Bathyarchaeales archaeon]
MKQSIKKLHVTLMLATFLAIALVCFPMVYSRELSAPEKAMAFLTDVVKLDMAKYNITLLRHLRYPSNLSSPSDEGIIYRLESNGSKFEAVAEFKKNRLNSFKIYMLEGSELFYAELPHANMLDAAKGLIKRYQTFSGDSYFQPMRNMLDAVTELKPMTMTSGNVKLRIRNNGPRMYIEWVYTANGFDIERKRIVFTFLDGSFERFGNSWDFYSVGTTELKVSREEAIRIAREATQKYSWRVGPAGEVMITNFTILDSRVSAELSWEVRENNTLYPWWNIFLYLDRVYPGNVYCIQVTLWGDTGEVDHIQAIGHLGIPPTEPTPTPPTQPTPTPPTPPPEPPTDTSTNKTKLNPTPIIMAASIISVATIGIAFYKKKKNRLQ